MPSNGEGPEIIEIPARIYPGMFEGEFQVSVEIQGEEINLMVSPDSVKFATPPNENGVEGTLLAEVVQRTPGDEVLIHLPGEVQGASNRIQYAAAS